MRWGGVGVVLLADGSLRLSIAGAARANPLVAAGLARRIVTLIDDWTIDPAAYTAPD